MKNILIFDGNYILRRSFYGIPELKTTKGFPTNAIKGSLNIILYMLNKYNPDEVIIAYDVRKPTFRHLMYNDYKATRDPAPEEFILQRNMIPLIIRSLGLCVIEKEGYEADDIIGTISTKESLLGNHVNIISADHDLFQLCDDNVSVIVPNNPENIWTPIEIAAEYNVTPKQFIDVKALMGDKSDNIPGAIGIGPKTASELIHKYGDILNVYLNISDINNNMPRGKSIASKLLSNWDNVLLSKTLVKIKTDVPLDEYKAEVPKNMLTDLSKSVLELYELNSIIHILQNGIIVRI